MHGLMRSFARGAFYTGILGAVAGIGTGQPAVIIGGIILAIAGRALLAALGGGTVAKKASPLLKAIEARNVPEVEKLLAEGANANEMDRSGRPALRLAAMDGKVKIVKLLLKAGANPNTREQDGATALTWAANQGQFGAVQALLADFLGI
jgi:hypothetical protein